MHTLRRSIILTTTLSTILCAAASSQAVVRDIRRPGPAAFASDVDEIVELNGVLVFAAKSPFGVELWRSDGTATGTRMVADLRPGPLSSSPRALMVAAGQVFFTAHVDGVGRELWRTDGTAAGTILLADALPGSSSGSPSGFVAYGGFLYFANSDRTSGREHRPGVRHPGGQRRLGPRRPRHPQQSALLRGR